MVFNSGFKGLMYVVFEHALIVASIDRQDSQVICLDFSLYFKLFYMLILCTIVLRDDDC